MTRRAWQLAHRYVGLSLAAFLVVLGATGSLLVFYSELDETFNSRMMRVVERDGPPLPIAAIIEKVETELPNVRVDYISLDRQHGQSIRMSVVPRAAPENRPSELSFDEVFADPFDGAILGTRLWGAFRLDAAHFMPLIYNLHYSLFLPGEWGVWLLGFVALVWMFDCVVGAYLTFPRAPPRLSRWRSAWGIKASRVTYDMHRATGLWVWIVLFTLAFTGVYFNLGEQVFKPVVALFGDITPYPDEQLAPRQQTSAAFSIDNAVDRARDLLPPTVAHYEPWYAGYIREKGAYVVGFKEPGYGYAAAAVGNEQVLLDGTTGAYLGSYGYESGTAADKFLLWQYPLHSGKGLGWTGRLLICLSGIVTVILSITGTILWLRKRGVERGAARQSALIGVRSADLGNSLGSAINDCATAKTKPANSAHHCAIT